MTEYFLSLTPEAPIRTGSIKPKGDYLDTKNYLPGSILRGALAEWLKLQGKESQIIPMVRKIRFGNFFPSPSERTPALPFPMTALECKLHGGFQKVPRNDERGHGIRDSLLVALAYTELEKRGAQFPVPMLLRCACAERGSKCGGRMERVNGFYAHMPEGWKKIEISKVLQTKVALSRHRRATQEAMLYRVVGIRPKCTFVGRVWSDSEAIVQETKVAVETVGVGALTGRGFGTVHAKEVKPTWEFVSERLKMFNEKLSEVWCDLVDLAYQVNSTAPNRPEGTYFSVNLLSPAVLSNPYGMPTLKLFLEINGKWLEPV
ncbi:MAG TPA: CRISPR-associated RAMP protein Csx10, partial [Clostridiaceae bacterium]|nr:CRISPR-associated RAMP protein Csx10 [Clostridiaceae bacterium]